MAGPSSTRCSWRSRAGWAARSSSNGRCSPGPRSARCAQVRRRRTAGSSPTCPSTSAILIDFRNRMDGGDLRPRLWVAYLREAWGSAFGDGARLTFDWGLRVQPPSIDRPFVPEPDEWVGVPLDQPCVLELKFNGAFPNWMLRMVRSVGLERNNCSKYLQGALRTGHLPWAALERGRRWTAFLTSMFMTTPGHEVGVSDFLLRLLVAWLAGQAIGWFYSWSHPAQITHDIGVEQVHTGVTFGGIGTPAQIQQRIIVA